MSYRVLYRASAESDLKSVPEPVQAEIRTAVRSLADNPRPPGAKKLVDMGNAYRIRIGQYRIGYQIADGRLLVVTIVAIGDRKAIYPLLKRRLKK